MTSLSPPQKHITSGVNNCTTASTFEKPNSFRCVMLFGDCLKKVPRESSVDNINAYDYIFSPNQIFGLSFESTGREFKKFHSILVLRACKPGEIGHIVPSVNPGAKILLNCSTRTAVKKLNTVFKELLKYGINLTKISEQQYLYLNGILTTRSETHFFTGELIARRTYG